MGDAGAEIELTKEEHTDATKKIHRKLKVKGDDMDETLETFEKLKEEDMGD